MKSILKAIIATSIINLLCGCSPDNQITTKEVVVELAQLNQRQGVYYLVNAENGYTGKAVRRLPNGQILIAANFLNGYLNGKFNVFNENGQMTRDLNYINGKQNGAELAINEVGVRLSSKEWSNGLLNGNQEYFYENGKTKIRENFAAGKRVQRDLFNRDGSTLNSNPQAILADKIMHFRFNEGGFIRMQFRANGSFTIWHPAFQSPFYNGRWKEISATKFSIAINDLPEIIGEVDFNGENFSINAPFVISKNHGLYSFTSILIPN